LPDGEYDNLDNYSIVKVDRKNQKLLSASSSLNSIDFENEIDCDDEDEDEDDDYYDDNGSKEGEESENLGFVLLFDTIQCKIGNRLFRFRLHPDNSFSSTKSKFVEIFES
jgi:hypothetical protein